jgi:hypothetical protein
MASYQILSNSLSTNHPTIRRYIVRYWERGTRNSKTNFNFYINTEFRTMAHSVETVPTATQFAVRDDPCDIYPANVKVFA